MTSHQSLQEPSDPGPPPKTDQIAQEIGKLIPLVNDITNPSPGLPLAPTRATWLPISRGMTTVSSPLTRGS